jgi:hypothetical protein
MEKQELLSAVSAAAVKGTVSEQELVTAFRSRSIGNAGGAASPDSGLHKKIGIAEILYYVGGLIVVMGIVILLFQNWDSLNSLFRILVSLGAALLLYVAGTLLSREENFEGIGQAFLLISVLVFPLGVFITGHEAGLRFEEETNRNVLIAIISAFYVTAFVITKKTLFEIFAIVWVTVLYFTVTEQLLGASLSYYGNHFLEYRFLIAGVSYILLGYYFAKGPKAALSSMLYSVGVLGVLGAAFALTGFDYGKNIFWELFYPILVFGVLFLSVYLKSRSFLIFGTLFLMAWIIKITGEYFSTGFGWALSLMIAGFCVIGVGYGSFYVNKKYLKNQSSQAPTP